MCRFAVELACLLGLAGSLWAWPFPGMVAPPFNLDGSLPGSGDSLRLSNMLGEVVYINFFGATCPVCVSDGWLSEQIYDSFSTNTQVNVIGIDVWNLPAPYVQGSFRANTGISYPLLVMGRTTGFAYDMENEPLPSPTDCDGRGHIVIDQQGIIRYYENYNVFDETSRDEIIAMIHSLLDPCYAVPTLAPPDPVVMVYSEETGLVLRWSLVPCATRYLIMRSVAGDFSDETLYTTTPNLQIIVDPSTEYEIFRVIAERVAP